MKLAVFLLFFLTSAISFSLGYLAATELNQTPIIVEVLPR